MLRRPSLYGRFEIDQNDAVFDARRKREARGSDARTGMPDSRSKCRPWSGHTTAVPVTMPSHSGPPLCGHAFSTARNRSSEIEDRDLAIADLHGAALAERNVFAAVIRIHLAVHTNCSSPFHRLNLHELRRVDRRLALQPRVVRQRLRSLQPLEQPSLLLVRRVHGFLADLLDAQRSTKS